MTLDDVKSMDFDYEMNDEELLKFKTDFFDCDKDTFTRIYLYLIDEKVYYDRADPKNNVNVEKIMKDKYIQDRMKYYHNNDLNALIDYDINERGSDHKGVF